MLFLNLNGNRRNIFKCFQTKELNLGGKKYQDILLLAKATITIVL